MLKRRVLTFVLLAGMVYCLVSCGQYRPDASKESSVSGQAVQTKNIDREPAIEEVEQAYHRAVQHEVYLGYMEEQDWFSGKKLKLYRKKEKNSFSYTLVGKTKGDEKNNYSVFDLLYYYDCEEPGFETSAVFDYNCEKKDIKDKLQGMEQIGTIDAWKWEGEHRPDYPQMGSATKKLVQRIQKKVIEEANEYCILSKKKTCHAYIQQFNSADRNVLVSLVIDEGSGKNSFSLCEFFCELHPELKFEFDYLNGDHTDDKWSFNPRYGLSDITEITDTAMTEFTFTIEPRDKLENMGLSEDEQKQIQLLSKNAKTYIVGDVERLQWMISDLNQNGRLEIVLTEISSHDEDVLIYEVSEDRKNLVPCKKLVGKTGDGVKTELYIAEKKNPKVYYDSANECYYYAAVTRWLTETEEVCEQEGDFCLKGNQLKERIFDEYCVLDRDDFEKVQEDRVKGKKVSKTEYRKAVERHWSGMEKKTAVFGWRSRGSLLTTADYDEEERAIRFAKSWQEFSVK